MELLEQRLQEMLRQVEMDQGTPDADGHAQHHHAGGQPGGHHGGSERHPGRAGVMVVEPL